MRAGFFFCKKKRAFTEFPLQRRVCPLLSQQLQIRHGISKHPVVRHEGGLKAHQGAAVSSVRQLAFHQKAASAQTPAAGEHSLRQPFVSPGQTVLIP